MNEKEQRFQVAVELDYDIHRNLRKYEEFLRKTILLRNQFHMRVIPRITGNYDTSTHRFYAGNKEEAEEFSGKLREIKIVKAIYIDEF